MLGLVNEVKKSGTCTYNNRDVKAPSVLSSLLHGQALDNESLSVELVGPAGGTNKCVWVPRDGINAVVLESQGSAGTQADTLEGNAERGSDCSGTQDGLQCKGLKKN